MLNILKCLALITAFFIPYICLANSMPPTESSKFVYEASEGTRTLTVNYFAFNSPSIQEYLNAKMRIAAALESIMAEGATPRKNNMTIGIGRGTIAGRNVGYDAGRILISIAATDAEIDGVLMGYFYLVSPQSNLYFFSDAFATRNQIRHGMTLVDFAIDSFHRQGINLVLPDHMTVAISGKAIADGNVTYARRTLYVSFLVSAEEIERFLMRFVN
jgi:hypothetical protein